MESSYSETHRTWNKIAQRYEEMFMDMELYNDTYIQFCNLLIDPSSSVLEIGCGPGNITQQVLKLKPLLKVLVTDVSNKMIELAKKNNPTVETKVLDCRDIDKVDATFNAIICGFTIPYLSQSDCAKLITDCSHLLNPKGTLYLSFVPGDYSNSGFKSNQTGDRAYFYYHNEDEIKKELESNGFTIADLFQKEYAKSDSDSEMHTIILASKTQE